MDVSQFQHAGRPQLSPNLINNNVLGGKLEADSSHGGLWRLCMCVCVFNILAWVVVGVS